MSFSIPFNLEEWLNQKIDTVRYEDWLKEDVFLHMKRKEITTKSKGLHSYVLFLKNEVEEYKQTLASEKLKIQSSNEPSIDCIHFIEPNQCLKDWLNKSQIRKVTPSICNKCVELQQEQRQREKINKRKSRNNSTPSIIHRKPTKIHCVGWDKEVDLNKDEVKIQCMQCKRKTFLTWVECKQKQFSTMTPSY